MMVFPFSGLVEKQGEVKRPPIWKINEMNSLLPFVSACSEMFEICKTVFFCIKKCLLGLCDLNILKYEILWTNFQNKIL